MSMFVGYAAAITFDLSKLFCFQIFIVMIVPLVSLIPDIFYSRYMIFSGLIGLVYQTMLSYCGLSNYIILGPNGDNSRDNFISANREGIFSCTGYIALYYVGVHVGRYTYQRLVECSCTALIYNELYYFSFSSMCSTNLMLS